MSVSGLVPISLSMYVSISIKHYEYYVQHSSYLADSQGPYEVTLKLKKSLLHERGWVELAENLGASTLQRDLSIDSTFSKIHLTDQ
jgi:hypothetical protein